MCLPILEELAARWGGKAQVDQAVASGHVIKAPNKKGMMMYFVPRHAYLRDNLYRQTISGDITKGSASIGDLADIQESKFHFSWDPSQLVPTALEGVFGAGASGAVCPPLTNANSPMPALPSLTIGEVEGWVFL